MTGARLLLVDDDRLVLATLATGLRQSGYSVTTADSAGTALARVAAVEPFDLAILDIRMPDASGIELARRLREHGVPALFLSAYADREEVAEAIREGALGYLVKPVDPANLVPAIESALARARDIDTLSETKSQLEHALASGRHTSMAVGMLMAQRGIDEAAAFNELRGAARAQRRKLEDYCADFVASTQRQRGD